MTGGYFLAARLRPAGDTGLREALEAELRKQRGLPALMTSTGYQSGIEFALRALAANPTTAPAVNDAYNCETEGCVLKQHGSTKWHEYAPTARDAEAARLTVILPAVINFRFLPPRVVDDPIWREIAQDIASRLPPAAASTVPTVPTVLDGATLIAAERQRQIDVEGYDAAHDAEHADELAAAGATYAIPLTHRLPGVANIVRSTLWPWGDETYKPTPDDRIRELTKAGALIAAAIDARLRPTPPDAEVARLESDLHECVAQIDRERYDHSEEVARLRKALDQAALWILQLGVPAAYETWRPEYNVLLDTMDAALRGLPPAPASTGPTGLAIDVERLRTAINVTAAADPIQWVVFTVDVAFGGGTRWLTALAAEYGRPIPPAQPETGE